jgi:hypothetical protein
MPVSQLSGQLSDWPANHLNMYGKVTYGQMIGRPIGRNICYDQWVEYASQPTVRPII